MVHSIFQVTSMSFNQPNITYLQVTCEYRMEKGACVPQRVHTVVVSVQHSEEITLEQLRKEIMEKVVRVVIPEKYLDEQTVYHIQPSGRFVIGGPQVRRIAKSVSGLFHWNWQNINHTSEFAGVCVFVTSDWNTWNQIITWIYLMKLICLLYSFR